MVTRDCLGEMQCEVVVGSYAGDIKGFRLDLLQLEKVSLSAALFLLVLKSPQSPSPLMHLIIIIIIIHFSIINVHHRDLSQSRIILNRLVSVPLELSLPFLSPSFIPPSITASLPRHRDWNSPSQ